MGDVTGPVSTLPGAGHALPAGTMCDDHPDRPAVARIQGETDSFGSELWDLCEECRDEMQKAIRRFLMHVLPDRFHRIRHYGFLAGAGRKEKVARIRVLLGRANSGETGPPEDAPKEPMTLREPCPRLR